MEDKINKPTAAAISSLCDRVHRAEQMIADIRSGEGNLLNDQGRICERLHADEQRIEALEAAERTGCPNGYFTVNGGPLRPCLSTLTKRYKSPPDPPTCGSCRWFNYDNVIAAPSGMCRAHPITVAKMSNDACGEHAPR